MGKEVKKQRKRWIKHRHKLSWAFGNFIFAPIIKHKYHLQYTKFKESKKRNFLVLINHQTPFDQFFFSLIFYGKKYLVVTEDVMRNGFLSSILRFMINPIPFRKSTNDISAVRNCLRVAKEGGTIFLAPEGNRTYSGKTGYIKPSVTKLAKSLKIPIAILKIEGGYSVQPRWSDVIRNGKCKAYISDIIEPETFKSLSDDNFYSLIKEKLYNDESGNTGIYKCKKQAEYIERALYVCPHCGLTTFESKKDIFTCKKCGLSVRYKDNKLFEGINKKLPFDNMGSWYDYQCKFIDKLQIEKYIKNPAYIENVNLIRIFEDRAKVIIGVGLKMSLYSNRFVIKQNTKSKIFNFDDITAVTVLGRNKMDFYVDDEVYQVRGGKRFNALKYMNFYYHYKNVKEDNNGKFLGI